MATTTLLSSLAIPALVAGVAVSLPTAAEAQDYTSGALVGTVTNAKGGAVAGATVVLTSKAQGQSRTLTTNANGQFTATGLAPGDYTVNVKASGYSDFSGSATIVISQETRFDYQLTAAGASTSDVVVKGKRVRQDFTKTTTGLTVDLDTLVAQQPIARNLTAVTMLAPTVTLGDPGFGNVASFGGGSVAENAYYVNGLNITNPDTYVGGADVPFDFYKTVEVKTGGYQAEYGRATGGVVNATTKYGTNNFMFALHGNLAPNSLRNDQHDYYNYDGKLAGNKNNTLGIEMGGPILKDHLFAYAMYQAQDTETDTAAPLSGTYSKVTDKDPFYGVKIDGYLNPTQHLELTYFNTQRTDLIDRYNYSGGVIGSYINGSHTLHELGGDSWVAKYTGNVTDWFTVSAAIGDMKTRDNTKPSDVVSYYVADYSTGSAVRVSPQTAQNYEVDGVERKFGRVDGDVRFDWMGRHHVRFGYDLEKNAMTHNLKLTGAQPVIYRINRMVGGVPKLQIVYENLGGHVSAENTALYIQDSWDLTPTFNLQLGLRSDNFAQNNLSGEKYLDLKNNVGPRLGFSWQPDADGKWKVFGNYGSYFIPPAMNLGFRGKDLYFAEYFSAPAGGWVYDPTTKLPVAVGNPFPRPSVGYSDACPASTLASAPGFNSTNAAAGTPACTVFGNGTQEGATSKTELNLKATEEDEFILGTTYRVNDLWTVGATATYRSLKRVSEDSDFNDAIIAYLDAKGLDSSQWDGDSSYYVWNVGDHDATVRLKHILPGETEARVITLTADQLGHYHNPKREYTAFVLDFKRAFDGKWGLQGNYTWSRSYGNYEGTVKSDVGNGTQDDAGATIAFDSPGFEDYGTGPLSNDRTHTFKVWGSYAFTPNFLIGANVLVQSPRSLSCLGYHPTDAYAASYGAYSHYCDGNPSALGKGKKTDWTKNLDLSMRYTVPEQYSLAGKLVLRADIFNLFDNHTVTTRWVQYELTGPGDHDPNYGRPLSYNTPRYVRLGFDLSY